MERRYSQTEKEALALVWACEKFHMYLYGKEFELLTDHKPLQFIFSPRSKVCARVERWILRLQSYKYKVVYIPGPQNVADCLSRLLNKSDDKAFHEETEQYICLISEGSTPTAMTTSEIEGVSSEDSDLEQVRKCLVTGNWNNLSCKEFLPVKNELCSIGHLVLRGTRIVIPETLREKILKLGHEGHPGIVWMKQRQRSKLWWPGLDKDIEKHCKSCYGCQLVDKPMNPEPLHRTVLPSQPWQDLAIDFLGPLPSGDSLFVLVDYYSRWVDVTIMKSTTTDKVIQSLKSTFATHGVPSSIRTDNGPQFVSGEFREFLKEHGIFHSKTTPLWPQANGEIERQNSSLLKRLKIAQVEKRN